MKIIPVLNLGRLQHSRLGRVSGYIPACVVLGKLAPGALFSFRIRGREQFFFLGPVIKKPHVQVLLEGYPFGDDARQISIVVVSERNRMPLSCDCFCNLLIWK